MPVTSRTKHTKYLSESEQEAVRAYIKERVLPKYTQEEACEHLGVSRSSLHRIMRGEQVVMPALAITVAKLTGAGMAELTGGASGHHASTFGQLPGYLDAERLLRDSKAVMEGPEFWLTLRDVTVPSIDDIKGVSPEDVFACAQFLRGLRKKAK